MTATATLLDIGFWRALILLAVSASITGAWGWFTARAQVRENRDLHERLDRVEQVGSNVAQRVGAAHPEGSPSPENDHAPGKATPGP